MTCIRTELANLPCTPIQIPDIVDVADFDDPLRTNHAISHSYHEFSGALSDCLGAPDLSNWCTFGRFASRGIGTLISEFDTFLGQPEAARADWVLESLHHIPGEMRALWALVELAIRRTLPGAGTGMPQVLSVVRDLRHLLPAIVAHLSASATQLRDNLVRGNRQIYEDLVPACQRFLQAVAGPADSAPGPLTFRPEKDPRGFLHGAFCSYLRVRELSELLCKCERGPEWNALYEARAALMHHGNLLLGYQEQLIIVQPIFNEVQEEMAAISRALYLKDPRGTYPLLPHGGSWGVFYQRMGIDAASAPADTAAITAEALPPMLGCKSPSFQGTIGQYFATGLLDPALQDPPADSFPPAGVAHHSSLPFAPVLSGLGALVASAA